VYLNYSLDHGDYQLFLEAIKERAVERYQHSIPFKNIMLHNVDKSGTLIPITRASDLKMAYSDAQPNLMKVIALYDLNSANAVSLVPSHDGYDWLEFSVFLVGVLMIAFLAGTLFKLK
jgi:hypothetical protein